MDSTPENISVEQTQIHNNIKGVAQLSSRMNQLNLFYKDQRVFEGEPPPPPPPEPPKEGGPKPIVPTGPGQPRPNEFRNRHVQGLRLGADQLGGAAGRFIGSIYKDSQKLQEAQLRIARERTAKLVEPIGLDEQPENTEAKPTEKPQPPNPDQEHEFAYNPVVDTRL